MCSYFLWYMIDKLLVHVYQSTSMYCLWLGFAPKVGGYATPFHELLHMPYECIIGIQPEEAGHASHRHMTMECVAYNVYATTFNLSV